MFSLHSENCGSSQSMLTAPRSQAWTRFISDSLVVGAIGETMDIPRQARFPLRWERFALDVRCRVS